MNRAIAPYILKLLEGITFLNQSHSSMRPLNYQVVRFLMERATKLLDLTLAYAITDVEKSFENVRIVGPLRSLYLTNVPEVILEPIFQLKRTLRKLTLKLQRSNK